MQKCSGASVTIDDASEYGKRRFYFYLVRVNNILSTESMNSRHLLHAFPNKCLEPTSLYTAPSSQCYKKKHLTSYKPKNKMGSMAGFQSISTARRGADLGVSSDDVAVEDVSEPASDLIVVGLVHQGRHKHHLMHGQRVPVRRGEPRDRLTHHLTDRGGGGGSGQLK